MKINYKHHLSAETVADGQKKVLSAFILCYILKNLK
jgi:hypothetical protein